MSKKTKDIFVNKYWQDRMAESQVKLANKSIKETEKQIQKYYTKAAEHCIESFEATYDKLLTAIEDGREPTPADLYKLDKYWQSQAQIRRELQKLGEREVAYMTKSFEEVWKDVYNSMALSSDSAFNTISTEAVNQLINQVWCADGKNWSSRIWDNTEKLAVKLNDELINIVATGKRTTDLKNTLIECFDVSYRQANMLVRTEVAHIQTQAAKQRYLDNGVTEVEIWADYDERRCDICGKLHQKKYRVNETLPIPAHPNCRCCIVPVIDNVTKEENQNKTLQKQIKKYNTLSANQGKSLTIKLEDDNIKIPQGMYKQTDKELEKGIKSCQKKIEEHQKKLQHPELLEDWEKLSEKAKQGTILHWEKELLAFENNIKAAEKLLKQRRKKK